MLAAAPGVGYIWEPFNVHCRPGICAAEFKQWFYYLNDKNGPQYRQKIQNTLSFHYDVQAELGALSSVKDVARMCRDVLKCGAFRYQKRRPLMKDPIALYAAEWLAQSFDMAVVVLIRHPAAFASSIVRYSMPHPFSDFLVQPEFMKDRLAPFEAQLREYASVEHDLLDQAILLWNICHDSILMYQKQHPEWIFVRHEDLAMDPVCQFEALYQQLGLQFNDHARRVIAQSASPKNPKEVTLNEGGLIRRDSYSTVFNWHKRLSPEQISRVREGTAEISAEFYDDTSWNSPA